MQRISQTIKILKYFRTIFDEYKENLAPFFGDRPIVSSLFIYSTPKYMACYFYVKDPVDFSSQCSFRKIQCIFGSTCNHTMVFFHRDRVFEA